eukprot:12855931-Alexandrium_andersonii.AAC.1
MPQASPAARKLAFGQVWVLFVAPRTARLARARVAPPTQPPRGQAGPVARRRTRVRGREQAASRR